MEQAYNANEAAAELQRFDMPLTAWQVDEAVPVEIRREPVVYDRDAQSEPHDNQTLPD